MSATGLDVFDRTIQLTNVWLDEIMETLPRNRKLAWNVLAAVLRTVRDRVQLNVAVHHARFGPSAFHPSWWT